MRKLFYLLILFFASLAAQAQEVKKIIVISQDGKVKINNVWKTEPGFMCKESDLIAFTKPKQKITIIHLERGKMDISSPGPNKPAMIKNLYPINQLAKTRGFSKKDTAKYFIVSDSIHLRVGKDLPSFFTYSAERVQLTDPFFKPMPERFNFSKDLIKIGSSRPSSFYLMQDLELGSRAKTIAIITFLDPVRVNYECFALSKLVQENGINDKKKAIQDYLSSQYNIMPEKDISKMLEGI